MKRSTCLLLLIIFTLEIMLANADNKLTIGKKMNINEFNSIMKDMDFSHKPTKQIPQTFGYASIKGYLEENKWFWITPENVSKIINPNNIFKRYESSEVYEEADSHAIPMQFKKIDGIYLPYIELHYTTLSVEKLDNSQKELFSKYTPSLDQQGIIYIDAITGEIISRNKAGLSNQYVYAIKKDKGIELTKVNRILHMAIEYSYYQNKHLKTKTTYTYSYKGEAKNDNLYMLTQFYKDSEENEITSHNEIITNANSIPNIILKHLFKNN